MSKVGKALLAGALTFAPIMATADWVDRNTTWANTSAMEVVQGQEWETATSKLTAEEELAAKKELAALWINIDDYVTTIEEANKLVEMAWVSKNKNENGNSEATLQEKEAKLRKLKQELAKEEKLLKESKEEFERLQIIYTANVGEKK